MPESHPLPGPEGPAACYTRWDEGRPCAGGEIRYPCGCVEGWVSIGSPAFIPHRCAIEDFQSPNPERKRFPWDKPRVGDPRQLESASLAPPPPSSYDLPDG